MDIWVDIKESDCWIVWLVYACFCSIPPDCVPKWLYHSVFLLAGDDNSYCSPPSPAFSVVKCSDHLHLPSDIQSVLFLHMLWKRWVARKENCLSHGVGGCDLVAEVRFFFL